MTMRLKPSVSRDTQFFWEGVAAQKLLIQRCAGCAKLRHPPRPMCPHCNSLEWEAIESSGKGVVYSFAMPHHPPLPFFEYPYIVVLVQLEEGTRIVSNLCGIEPSLVKIGMPVEVYYETFDDGVILPLFRPSQPMQEKP